MTALTYCKNRECPLRSTCRRATAETAATNGAFYQLSPSGKCTWFIPTASVETKKRRRILVEVRP